MRQDDDSNPKIGIGRRLSAIFAALLSFVIIIALLVIVFCHSWSGPRLPAGAASAFHAASQVSHHDLVIAGAKSVPLASLPKLSLLVPLGSVPTITLNSNFMGSKPVSLGNLSSITPGINPVTPTAKAPGTTDDAARWLAVFHPSQTDHLHVSTISLTGQPDPIDEAERLEKTRPYVMSLCLDHRDKLWIGTEDGGIERFDPAAQGLQKWTYFTTKQGLGDNNGYAIACDHRGRIWVGHLNHGVSVYNGEKFQIYDVVGGLSRPDTLSGPLGERVFHISVCPTDGDVWIATNAGLTRYSDSKDTWSYYTRANGLPSDATNGIAFDKEGNIYVTTLSDGIAMADASDDYQNWRQVKGPEELPIHAFGKGLPSNLLNDVLVAKDGTVYIATDAGLAWSIDRGANWQYVRGREWADKVRGSAAGPPKGWVGTPAGLLAEDYVSCLSEDEKGLLYLGHRRQGVEILKHTTKGNGLTVQGRYNRNTYVDALPLPMEDGIAGTYGNGIVMVGKPSLTATKYVSSVQPSALPSGAKPPTLAALNQLLRASKNGPCFA